MLRAHGMKSNEKLFFFSEKFLHIAYVVIDRYFSLFLNGFEDFS